MSSDDADTRESILRLVRKSVLSNYNSESLWDPSNYSKYRTKFLECRKQFEHPPPPIQKQPFFPHWVRPEYNTDLPITYKKRGDKITDVRINLLKNSDGNNHEIGNRMESNEFADVTENAKTLPNEDLKNSKGPKLVLVNGEEATSSSIGAASHSIYENPLATSEERIKRRMDRHSRYVRSIKRFQSLGIIEEKSSSISSGSKSNLVSNGIADTPKQNSSTLSSDAVILCKPILCRPIVRKAIELKKYDHIVTNVIRNKKNRCQFEK